MNADIEALYQGIGQEAYAIAPDAQGTLLVYAEVEDGVISADLFYNESPSGKVIFKHCPESLLDLIYSLWEKWKAYPGNEEWRAMTYLIQDGDFSIDFTYPDRMKLDEGLPDRRPRVIEQHFGNANVDYSTP